MPINNETNEILERINQTAIKENLENWVSKHLDKNMPDPSLPKREYFIGVFECVLKGIVGFAINEMNIMDAQPLSSNEINSLDLQNQPSTNNGYTAPHNLPNM